MSELHRITVRVNPDRLKQTKIAVRAAQRDDVNFTMERAYDRALELLIRELEKKHNGGEPFKSRGEIRLRPGRRIKLEE